jgi:hypothetical protein
MDKGFKIGEGVFSFNDDQELKIGIGADFFPTEGSHRTDIKATGGIALPFCISGRGRAQNRKHIFNENLEELSKRFRRIFLKLSDVTYDLKAISKCGERFPIPLHNSLFR